MTLKLRYFKTEVNRRFYTLFHFLICHRCIIEGPWIGPRASRQTQAGNATYSIMKLNNTSTFPIFAVSGAQLQYLASTNTLSNIGATPVQASSIITALGMPSNATTGKVPGTNAGGASPKSIPVLVEKSGLDFDSPKLDSLPVDPDAAVVGAGTAAYPGTAAHPTTTQTFNSDGGQDVIIEMGTGSNTILGKGSHTPMSRKFAMALIFFFGCLVRRHIDERCMHP